MTLQELKYIVAVAKHRHFGRAAKACFVSQPALSAAVRKLEDELDIIIFERNSASISLTAVGRAVVDQASLALAAADSVRTAAMAGRDPLTVPLTVGLIYTVGPYLLPYWIPHLHHVAPRLPVQLEEGFTHGLTEKLRNGEIDAAVVAAPYAEPGIQTCVLYEEALFAAAPIDHPWRLAQHVTRDMLAEEQVLLLAAGNCFRDQVLQACPDLQRQYDGITALSSTVRGSSLLTISHMVIAGMGVTVLPASAALLANPTQLSLRPLKPAQFRQVLLAWRNNFSRLRAIDLVRETIGSCGLTSALARP